MTITYPYWNNDEVISSDKLNSMVQAIINGDPLAVKVSNATKNDVNQIVGYLSSLHDKAKTNLNSATSTSAFDTAYTNMTALVSNKLGAYANDDTVDLYSTGIRASIIAFLQAYDNMMSNDRLNNKNTDNTLGSRIDSEAIDRKNADIALDTKIFKIQSNGGGRNLLQGTRDFSGDWLNLGTYFTKTDETYNGLSVVETNGDWAGASKYYPVKKGETYTFSLFARYTSGTGTSNIYVLLNTDPENGFTQAWVDNVQGGYSLDTNWKKCRITFTATTNGYIKPRMERDGSNTNTLQICGYMLEKGTVSHDWSPAPEDIDAKITVLNDTVMKNRGTADAPDFNSLTQAGYYTITNLTQGKNYPTSSWGTLEVSGQVADVNGRLNQKYVSDNGGTAYTRQYNNSTKMWTAWVKIANQYDINSVRDLANSKANTTDINWSNVANNSSNTYNYASGSKIILPNNSSITVNGDRIISNIKLPSYFTDNISTTSLDIIGNAGEYDNVFVSSATMSTLTGRPINPDTGASLTGDCFFSNHFAYSGTNLRVMQQIYSCDYNYTFTRSYNSSSGSWTNWSCLTPYA